MAIYLTPYAEYLIKTLGLSKEETLEVWYKHDKQSKIKNIRILTKKTNSYVLLLVVQLNWIRDPKENTAPGIYPHHILSAVFKIYPDFIESDIEKVVPARMLTEFEARFGRNEGSCLIDYQKKSFNLDLLDMNKYLTGIEKHLKAISD